MNRIRLLQLIPSLRCGGAERMVVSLMTHLDRRRFEAGAVVLARQEGGALEQAVSDAGFPVWWLGKDGACDPKMLYRIRRVVRRFRPHLVHSHLCLHYVFPALAGRRYRHVTTAHLPGDTKHPRWVLPLTRLAFRRGVVPVAVSGDVAEWLKRVCAVHDCAVIPNGIPLGDYRRAAASRLTSRKALGLRGDDVAYVCVARLEEQKNHAMLLEAFAGALRAEERAHLLLVGDGACRADLERRAHELQVTGQVRFLGQRRDVPRLLAASDVFVLASHNEGNPLALMEAMAAGLPVAATAVGGVPELVANRQSGLLVRPGDRGGLASALLHLFRDEKARRSMAACAAEQADRSFSAARMARAYMQFYERVLAGGPRSPHPAAAARAASHFVRAAS